MAAQETALDTAPLKLLPADVDCEAPADALDEPDAEEPEEAGKVVPNPEVEEAADPDVTDADDAPEVNPEELAADDVEDNEAVVEGVGAIEKSPVWAKTSLMLVTFTASRM